MTLSQLTLQMIWKPVKLQRCLKKKTWSIQPSRIEIFLITLLNDKKKERKSRTHEQDPCCCVTPPPHMATALRAYTLTWTLSLILTPPFTSTLPLYTHNFIFNCIFIYKHSGALKCTKNPFIHLFFSSSRFLSLFSKHINLY